MKVFNYFRMIFYELLKYENLPFSYHLLNKKLFYFNNVLIRFENNKWYIFGVKPIFKTNMFEYDEVVIVEQRSEFFQKQIKLNSDDVVISLTQDYTQYLYDDLRALGNEIDKSRKNIIKHNKTLLPKRTHTSMENFNEEYESIYENDKVNQYLNVNSEITLPSTKSQLEEIDNIDTMIKAHFFITNSARSLLGFNILENEKNERMTTNEVDRYNYNSLIVEHYKNSIQIGLDELNDKFNLNCEVFINDKIL